MSLVKKTKKQLFAYTYGRNQKSKEKLESSFVFTLNLPFHQNLYGHETKIYTCQQQNSLPSKVNHRFYKGIANLKKSTKTQCIRISRSFTINLTFIFAGLN